MEKDDVLEIAEGMHLIEEGVAKIQAVMRERKFKSLKDMAEELIPLFNEEDDSLTEKVVKHLGKGWTCCDYVNWGQKTSIFGPSLKNLLVQIFAQLLFIDLAHAGFRNIVHD